MITAWYGSAATSRTVIDHYRSKLESLRLDGSTDASQYVNDFIICSQKLEEKNEGCTAETKGMKFLDQILDEDYDVSKQLLSNATTTFEECVQGIRTREQSLLKDGGDALKKARRFKKTNKAESKGETTSSGMIPSIPGYILYKIKPVNVKQDLIRWRGIYNSEGRIIRADELAAQPAKDGTKDDAATTKTKRDRDDSSTQGSGNGGNSGKGKGKGKKTRRRVKVIRRTITEPTGTLEPKATGSTVAIAMKDEEDEGDFKSGDENDDGDPLPRMR